MNYQVNEIFTSIQGEGVLAGAPSTFIRLQGCPVACKWCDSVRTWGPGSMTDDYRAGWHHGMEQTKPDETYVAVPADVMSAMALRNGSTFQVDSSHYDYERGWVAGVLDATEMLPLEIGELGIRFYQLLAKQATPPSDFQLLLDYYQPKLWRPAGMVPARNGRPLDAHAIAQMVSARNVVITGGEPILWNLDPLIDAIQQASEGFTHIQIETSGLNDFKGDLRPDWVTWSPKENLKFSAPESFLFEVSEVKWVVDEDMHLKTIVEAIDMFKQLNPDSMPLFVLMPEGSPPSSRNIAKTMKWLGELEEAFGTFVDFRFGPRLQYWLGVR